MTKSEMLECLINFYTGGNKAKFATMIGVNAQNVSAWIARDTFDAELLYNKCEGVSAEWLLSHGDGEMIKDKQNVGSPFNSELILLCKQIVDNYNRKEEAIKKLSSMLERV